MACIRLHKIVPIMLVLCLMLLDTYYAKNYAGIIDSGLYIPKSLSVNLSVCINYVYLTDCL